MSETRVATILHDAIMRFVPSGHAVNERAIFRRTVPIIVDTGVLLGAIDAGDRDHLGAVAVLEAHVGQLLVAAPVVVETAWQLETNVGVEAEASLLDAIVAEELLVVELTMSDYARSVALIGEYADLGLGLVDASVVAIAERLKVERIATLNRRDFNVVRPQHCDGFELIP